MSIYGDDLKSMNEEYLEEGVIFMSREGKEIKKKIKNYLKEHRKSGNIIKAMANNTLKDYDKKSVDEFTKFMKTISHDMTDSRIIEINYDNAQYEYCKSYRFIKYGNIYSFYLQLTGNKNALAFLSFREIKGDSGVLTTKAAKDIMSVLGNEFYTFGSKSIDFAKIRGRSFKAEYVDKLNKKLEKHGLEVEGKLLNNLKLKIVKK